MAGGTILKLGYTNPLTGVFGAHPQLGAVLDLDDAATFTLLSPDGLDLTAPARTVVPAGNIRSQGERATRAIYRENRAVSIPLLIGPMQSAAGLASTIRTLAAWLDAPPAVPITVQWQPPGATAPLYLDVVAAAHSLGSDERDWLRLQMEDVEIVLWVRPGLRGDRVTLSNLASNPGFEQGSGPGVTVFADPLVNLNAYTQVSGSAPSLAPANTYVDIVQAVANGGGSLLRYFRLGESSGVVAPDVSGLGQNGTYQGAFTRGATGAISGDADTAITFAGAGDISVPMGSGASALPTGANPWSIAAWVKIAGNPASPQVIAAFGAAVAGQGAHIAVDTTGKVYASVFGTNTPLSAVALSLNVWHLVVGTYDGTTLRCYLDNAAAVSVAVAANIGATAARIAQQVDGTASISAVLDEIAYYGAALSGGQVGTLFTAGSSGASGTQANAMSLPAASEISFGSASWGAINTWSVRLRWDRAIVTVRLRLHRVDGSNDVEAQVTQTGVNLAHRVGGVLHTVAAVGATLASGAWYWLQCTQYPAPPGDPPYLSASLYADDGGQVGALVVSATGAAFDAVTALACKSGLQVDGAALVVGGTLGNAAGAGQQVSLFGPGGWSWVSVGTGVVSGAWDGSTANTAPAGDPSGVVPVQSYGAARLDFPPAGTFDGAWAGVVSGSGVGNPANGAIPATVGQVFQMRALVKSSGLDVTASTRFWVQEFDASGGFLSSSNVTGTGLTGNIGATWTALTGSYTVQNASCAWIGVGVRCSSSQPGSAGASVWIENVQVWNQTTTGVGANGMPYCELRFPQSPAQLIVSGLLGDLPAPVYIGLGTFVSSLPKGGSLAFALGRAAQAAATARLVGPAHGYYGAGGSPIATAVLDAAAYGGYYPTALANSGWTPRAFSMAPADAPGVYHLFTRIWTAQLLANLSSVTARANVQVRSQAWYGQLDNSDVLWEAFGPFTAPFSASSTWTVADTGQATLPPAAYGGLVDLTQNVVAPRTQLVDNNGGGSQMRADWQALLPVDGSLVVGSFVNPSNAVGAISAKWVWAHFDGLLVNRAGASDGPSWLYAVETMPTATPAHAAGGPGNTGTGFPSVNSGADPYLSVDPTVAVPQTGVAGVNLLVGYMADAAAGAVLPLHTDISYDPLYLWPR